MRELFPFIPEDRALTSPHDLSYYGKDWLKEYTPAPSLVLLPVSEDEVVQILRVCHARKIPVVPSGGRTGLSGGATATHGEVILSLEKMNRVRRVEKTDRTITVEAGVTTQRVQDEARAHGLYFPVEFTTKGTSQIGGNVATNAGGIRVVRYGNTRDWIIGLRAVTATGEVLPLGGSLFKNQTGYDLKSILIGSEGTLAVITEVTLKLTSIPDERVRALCALSSIDAVLPLLTNARDSFSTLSAFEYFTEDGLKKVLAHNPLPRPFREAHDTYILLEIERSAKAPREELEEFFASQIEAGLVVDVVLSETSKQAEDLMALRERLSETLSVHYFPHKNDISVPVPSIPQFVKELREIVNKSYPDFEVAIFGHIGDGNLHVNILKPQTLSAEAFHRQVHETDHALFALVQKFKGSISAEHGVGLLKKPYLKYSRTDTELALMRSIKSVFDPAGILNPGKVV